LTLNTTQDIGTLDNKQLPLALDAQPPETNIKQVQADVKKLQKEVARFEYESYKFKANVDNVMDIRTVPPADIKRNKSVGVVIGIEEYESQPSAPYADNDAEVMKEILRELLLLRQVKYMI